MLCIINTHLSLSQGWSLAHTNTTGENKVVRWPPLVNETREKIIQGRMEKKLTNQKTRKLFCHNLYEVVWILTCMVAQTATSLLPPRGKGAEIDLLNGPDSIGQ